jgi:hypothetical protein
MPMEFHVLSLCIVAMEYLTDYIMIEEILSHLLILEEDRFVVGFVIAIFASPLLSFTEGLFPFPCADLSSLFDKSRDQNKQFSTYTCPISYKTSVYASCSTTACIHWDLCQKIQKWNQVSMSRQEISNPWPSIYWKCSDSALQLHFEGYKRTISSYGKRRKNSTLRAKLLWRTYFILSLHPFVPQV